MAGILLKTQFLKVNYQREFSLQSFCRILLLISRNPVRMSFDSTTVSERRWWRSSSNGRRFIAARLMLWSEGSWRNMEFLLLLTTTACQHLGSKWKERVRCNKSEIWERRGEEEEVGRMEFLISRTRGLFQYGDIEGDSSSSRSVGDQIASGSVDTDKHMFVLLLDAVCKDGKIWTLVNSKREDGGCAEWRWRGAEMRVSWMAVREAKTCERLP